MTRRVGRSDGSHPQGRRRPQPAPPLRPLGGAPVRTRTGSAERDRASVLIERFPCLCTTLPFRHGRACPGHPYGRAPVKRPGGGRCPEPSPGMTRWVGRSGVGHEEGRTAGPEHATACRAVWRVGKRARSSRPPLREMKEERCGQATAVTVPRVPRGGGRLSRSARWPMRVRAAQMFRLSYITGSNASSRISL